MGCVQTRKSIIVNGVVNENEKINLENSGKENEIVDDKSIYSSMRYESRNNNQSMNINKTKSERGFGSVVMNNDRGRSRKSLGGLSFRDTNRKLTQEIEKIEDFEKRRKNTNSFKVDVVSLNVHLLPLIKEEEEKEKERDTIIGNLDIIPKKTENNTFRVKLNTDNENNEGFFIENNSHIGYNSNKENLKIKVTNTEDENTENTNYITGFNISAVTGGYKTPIGKKMSSIVLNNTYEGTKPQLKQNGFTEHTIDYSSMEEKSPSTHSPYKVVRKYNLNPYHNFNIVKKYFIYQLQKGFLHAKKFMINNEVHRGDKEVKKNPNYHDIFTNYSQISSTSVTNYVKYEDHNIKINNYYIQKNKILGKGGFSTVYLCQHLRDGKNYAVKITDKNVRANAKKKKYDYVKDEVIILKRLYSRYIVKTYEILETKNECLIFMEYMKNNSLYGKINTLDDFTIWKYFRNLICGLEHCHEIAKIIHRDINVNNLLISNDDVLKLSDFGISMIIEEDDLIPTNSGPTTFTPPEKKFNKNSHYNGKPADLWCCGITLYHMIYKRPVFKNSSNISNNEYNVVLPDDPNQLIDENLKELMLRLLDVDPINRYTISDIKKNKWITNYGEFPLPDVHEEALEYVYSLTSQEILGFKDNEVKEDYSP